MSDSPLSSDEPAAFSDITSAESFFAASSKLDEVRVDDSKKRLSTSLPCSVGSFSSTPAKRAGGLEDSLDVVAREVGNRDQMPHLASSGVPTRRIRSAPSISSSSTWIRSLRAVGRFLPT